MCGLIAVLEDNTTTKIRHWAGEVVWIYPFLKATVYETLRLLIIQIGRLV